MQIDELLHVKMRRRIFNVPDGCIQPGVRVLRKFAKYFIRLRNSVLDALEEVVYPAYLRVGVLRVRKVLEDDGRWKKIRECDSGQRERRLRRKERRMKKMARCVEGS